VQPDEADLVQVGTPIDLDNCAREPIHVPGSVQPRGVLVVAQEPHLTITQVSANVVEVFGRTPEELLGQRIDELVGPTEAAAIERAAAGFGDLRERNPLEITVPVEGRDIAFDAILHRESSSLLLVELELATGPRPFSFPNTYLAVRGSVADLNRASSIDELYDITARAVRELTGFDRVMVYRYDADYNGEVVAEAKRDDLNSFLGLHYPASDIPAQARALYEKNWLRIIDDVDYTPSPIVPVENPATGRPIDLTHSTLRSVSPIHIEYLKNMGVSASMSISLMRNGRLWGLIACHHYSGPHLPPYGVRTAAEFLGSTLSLRLVDRVEDEELRGRLAGQAVLAKIVAAMQDHSESLPRALLGATDILDLVPADGVALDLEGETAVEGTVPPEPVLAQIVAWCLAQDAPVVATDCLMQSAGIDVDPGVASGALAIVLADNQYVLWLRGELRRSVDWGGDPTNKAIAVQEGASVRLSPRKSFDRWREVVRNRSAPWLPAERSDAAALRQTIVEALYSRAEREVRLAETLQRSLLPDIPALPGWAVSARYDPAAGGRIGGDWYDAFALQDGRFVLVLGDVAGHGITAAGSMAQLRNALRAYLVDGVSTVGAVERLNEFTTLLLPGAFATMALASLDPATGELDTVLAGHPVPLLIGADGARPAPLTPSPPIGVPGVAYRSAQLTLAPGEGLILYSDGLVERRDEDLSDSVHSFAENIDRLGQELTAESVFEAHRSADAADDRTVVVVRRAR
jgi:two-component system, chemotaxis family, sensor kinase Cph1